MLSWCKVSAEHCTRPAEGFAANDACSAQPLPQLLANPWHLAPASLSIQGSERYSLGLRNLEPKCRCIGGAGGETACVREGERSRCGPRGALCGQRLRYGPAGASAGVMCCMYAVDSCSLTAARSELQPPCIAYACCREARP